MKFDNKTMAAAKRRQRDGFELQCIEVGTKLNTPQRTRCPTIIVRMDESLSATTAAIGSPLLVSVAHRAGRHEILVQN